MDHLWVGSKMMAGANTHIMNHHLLLLILLILLLHYICELNPNDVYLILCGLC